MSQNSLASFSIFFQTIVIIGELIQMSYRYFGSQFQVVISNICWGVIFPCSSSTWRPIRNCFRLILFQSTLIWSPTHFASSIVNDLICGILLVFSKFLLFHNINLTSQRIVMTNNSNPSKINSYPKFFWLLFKCSDFISFSISLFYSNTKIIYNNEEANDYGHIKIWHLSCFFEKYNPLSSMGYESHNTNYRI